MSHSTVTVVIRHAENAADAEAQLEELLDPFDENREMDPYPVWLHTDEVEQAVRLYREHPDYCTEDEGGPVKPFDEYVTEGNLEAWNEWTRQAVGCFHGNGQASGIYDAEKDQFGYLSTYNPDSRWDWWTLGGRWHGFYQLKPKVVAGSEKPESWRTQFGDSVEGSQQIPNFDGSQDAILGLSGVGGDRPDEDFSGVADLARKGDIDFEAMRTLAGHHAELAYDKFEEATQGIELPESWDELLKRTFFDNDLDPDEILDTDTMTREYVEAWHNLRREVVSQARAAYGEQPFIKALSKANLMSMFGDPLEDWCIREGGRATYVQRAIEAVGGTFAVLLDGTWHEKGKMGWFGMVGGEKRPEDWYTQQRRLIDSLPDEAYLAVVDCHI
jgi:hypothetical protein